MIAGIIQARMGSSRFPGKMMQKLGDYPLIEWVIARVKNARKLDVVVLATSTRSENDILETVASRKDIRTFRGEEDDVLGRFLNAATQVGATHVVRICADNPFVAPEEIDRLVDFYNQERPDYAFNHIPRLNNNYPDGLGAEMLSVDLLATLAGRATEPMLREHVTMYIWQRPDQFRIKTFAAPPGLAFPHIKLDVDTPSDLERLAKLKCVRDIGSSAAAVVESYLAVYPD